MGILGKPYFGGEGLRGLEEAAGLVCGDCRELPLNKKTACGVCHRPKNTPKEDTAEDQG